MTHLGRQVALAVLAIGAIWTESAYSAFIRRPQGSTPSLTASPSVIDNVGKPSTWKPTVTVEWQGAQAGDLVGLYWTTNQTSYPYAIFFVSEASGTREVDVINFRQPFAYALIRLSSQAKLNPCHHSPQCDETSSKRYTSALQSNTVLAWSNPVQFKDPSAPQHLHIAQGANASEITVMWNSLSSSTPWVRIGKSSNQLNSFFSGSVSTYSISDMCDSPATDETNFISPGIISEVLLSGLEPATKYYYQITNGKSSGPWNSSVEYFFTAPHKGTDDSVSSIVFGDIGVYMPFTTTIPGKELNFSNFVPANESMEFLAKSTADLTEPLNIVHIGDLSYARGYAVFWEYFMSQIASVASRVPYMVGIGNHEYDWPGQPFKPSWNDYGTDSGGECGVPYFKRFSMPTPSGSQDKNLYYSFDWGPIHYVVISTETDFVEGSAQYEWTVNDLESIDRDEQPWIIFMGHRPMYTCSTTFSLIPEHLKETYEPLFRKYHVDLALWGHVHQYERTAPISRNATEAPPGHGTVHVIIGNAGNTYQVPWAGSTINYYPEPDWVVFRSLDYGVGGIRASKQELSFAMHDDNRFLVHDSFTLYAKDQEFRHNH
eukprot:gb/GECG01011381.1/.p1 GENE.gb/GECG01011381.1/~~gb/GECG01011381.1/.p1  ORF type:complete len:601 (+),score=26.91 gb/GECG01011381.1/:1-1803(+)